MMASEMIECPACEGDLKCWACEGKDENCEICDGEKTCPRCMGEGFVSTKEYDG